MADCDDLLEAAKNAPHNFPYSDLIKLANCWGFKLSRQKGSHEIYKQTQYSRPDRKYARLVLQPEKGQAKPYQIKQVLKAIEYYENEYY